MEDQKNTKGMLKTERVETLILMSELAQDTDRRLATQELQRRKIAKTTDRLADAFMLLL